DPPVWLEESRKMATENVYTPEVLEPLNIVVRGLAEKPQEITLSEAYLKNAGKIAQIRATEAAYRLSAGGSLFLVADRQSALSTK
ncbi:MAG: hypothetical protein ACKO8U_15070, partial [Pirellula sp.]